MKHSKLIHTKKHPNQLVVGEKTRFEMANRYLTVGRTKKGLFAELLNGSKRTCSFNTLDEVTSDAIIIFGGQ